MMRINVNIINEDEVEEYVMLPESYSLSSLYRSITFFFDINVLNSEKL